MMHTTRNYPPNYPGTVDLMVPSGAPELPTYSPRRLPAMNASRFTLVPEERIKPFEYDIKIMGKPIASLTLLAESALSKHIPTFVQGSPVKGRVYLSADKIDGVRAITVTIQGKIIAGADPAQHQTFLDIKKIIWTSAEGVPSRTVNKSRSAAFTSGSNTVSSDTSSSSSGAGAFESNIRHTGQTWDFAVHLPDELSVPYGRSKQMGTFALPETFTERLARAGIAYEISVRYSRGKWQTDYRVTVPFGYIPMTRPTAFSPLRQLSYQKNAPLPGPSVDVDGWHHSKDTFVRGTLFNRRSIDVQCSLFLAKPLVYTRGSLIPLSLCLSGEDQHGLDMLSSPEVIDIRLGRRVRYHCDATNAVGALSDTIDFFDRAVLWSSDEGARDSSGQLRFLQGELHIRSDAKPTSAMGDFRIEYSVLLLAFETPGFEPLEQKPYIIQPVDIVSLHAPGPRPIKYAPGYEVLQTYNQNFVD